MNRAFRLLALASAACLALGGCGATPEPTPPSTPSSTSAAPTAGAKTPVVASSTPTPTPSATITTDAPDVRVTDPVVLPQLIALGLEKLGPVTVFEVAVDVTQNLIHLITNASPDEPFMTTTITAEGHVTDPDFAWLDPINAPLDTTSLDYESYANNLNGFAGLCALHTYSLVTGTHGSVPLIRHLCLDRDGSGDPTAQASGETHADNVWITSLTSLSEGELARMISELNGMMPPEIAEIFIPFADPLSHVTITFRSEYRGTPWPVLVRRIVNPDPNDPVDPLGSYWNEVDLSDEGVRAAELARIPEQTFPWGDLVASTLAATAVDAELMLAEPGNLRVGWNADYARPIMTFSADDQRAHYELDGSFIDLTRAG